MSETDGTSEAVAGATPATLGESGRGSISEMGGTSEAVAGAAPATLGECGGHRGPR